MSTRCNIALENLDGTVRAIYCHHDGYPEGVGSTIATYYRTEEQINALLDGGNLSALDQTPVESKAYGGNGEDAIIYANRAEFAKMALDSDLEYLYLNVCGTWLVFNVWHDQQWRRLSEVITIEEPENDGVVVTAEQVKRVKDQYDVYFSMRCSFKELQRRAASLVYDVTEFEPTQRARNLASLGIDKALNEQAEKIESLREAFRRVKELVDKGFEEVESKAI